MARAVLRNIRSVLIVAAVYALVIFGPSSAKATTDAICFEQSREPVATFQDMDACVVGTGLREEWRYCTCSVQPNALAKYHYWIGVPIAFIVVAFAVTSGTWAAQLLQLNSAILGGGVLLIAFYAYRGELYDLGLPFSFVFLCLLSVGASGGLVVLRVASRLIQRWQPR